MDVRATINTVTWDDKPDCTETSPSINAPTILKVEPMGCGSLIPASLKIC